MLIEGEIISHSFGCVVVEIPAPNGGEAYKYTANDPSPEFKELPENTTVNVKIKGDWKGPPKRPNVVAIYDKGGHLLH